MYWNEAYGNEIDGLFEEAAGRTSELPEPFRSQGRALLAKLNPRQSGESSNYITFLLPFWLRETAEAPERLCLELAAGNVCAMAHFFLMDDVMDGETGSGRLGVKEALALGQLFDERFRQYYGRHFPAESKLWDYYRVYLGSWASAVASEGQAPADPRDARQLAAKSAPVKLCAAGLLLLAGKEAAIPELEQAIDLVLAAQQIADDWADWKDDLAGNERCNAFLTLVRGQLQLPPDEPLDELKVKGAVYRAGALDRLADIADEYGERLNRLAGVPAPLRTFYDQIAEHLRRDAAQAAETTRKLAAEGGLFYNLS